MLGIVCAMEKEIVHVLNRCTDITTEELHGIKVHKGKLGNTEVALIQSGVGKVASAIATAVLCEQFPLKAVINVGIAGALSPSLSAFDCVLPDKLDQWDFDTTVFGDPRGFDLSERTCYADENLLKLMQSVLKNAIVAPLVSGDQFVSTSEQKAIIHRYFPEAVACDMEGAAIAAAAAIHHVPFAALRTISDSGNEMDYNEFCRIAAEKAAECIARVAEQM